MFKYIITAFLLVFASASHATSLTIQPRYSNSFRFAATDVWNVDLLFSATKSLNVYVVAEISRDGARIATLKSSAIGVNPGAQSHTAATISTNLLSWHSQAVSDIENLTGSFPAGTYQVCYFAYCITADCDGLGSDALYNEVAQCFDLIVEPPTPILLSFPEDQSEIEWKRPTFNWIPPMPISQVQGFNYLYLLVEKEKGQSCADAVIRNRPMYKQSGIDAPTNPYPPELNDLDTGKSYCWKVDGLVDGINVAQSEVWEFRLKPEEKIKRDTFRYAKFSTKIDAGNIELKQNSLLYFVCTGSYNGEFLKINVTGDDNFSVQLENSDDGMKKVEMARPNEENTILHHFGVNKYSLDISKIPGLTTGYYTLEILGQNHIPYFLKIKIIE